MNSQDGKDGALLRRIDSEAAPARRLQVTFGVAEGFCTVATAAFAALLLVEAIEGTIAFSWLFAAVGALAIRIGFALASDHWGRRASAKAARCARKEALGATLGLSPRQPSEMSGALASAVVDAPSAIRAFSGRYRAQMILTVAVPLLLALAAFAGAWVAGFVMLTAVVSAPVLVALVGAAAKDAATDQQIAVERLSGAFLDRLSRLPLILAYGAEIRTESAMFDAADELRKRTMRILRTAFLSSAAIEFFAAIAIASAAIYVGLSLMGLLPFSTGETVTLAEGLFVLILAPEAFAPIRRLAGLYHTKAEAEAASRRIAALSQSPRLEIGERVIRTSPTLRFEAVAVLTTEDDAETCFLTFAARPGRVTVLAGPSGCGKTTALHAVLGFAPIQSGRIIIDDAPLSAFARHAVAEAASWADQHPYLFAGTVADNLRMARPAADLSALNAAAAEVGLLDELADRGGLETKLGEGGVGLSVGQARRLAVARAILKDAPLALFDEPGASLDVRSEALIAHAIRRMADAGKTVVLATHSERLIDMADHVVRMPARASVMTEAA